MNFFSFRNKAAAPPLTDRIVDLAMREAMAAARECAVQNHETPEDAAYAVAYAARYAWAGLNDSRSDASSEPLTGPMTPTSPVSGAPRPA